MKKYLIFILFPLLFTGCITQKKCNEKYPPISQTETVYDTIVEKDSVYVSVKDTVYIVSVGKDTTIYKTDTVEL